MKPRYEAPLGRKLTLYHISPTVNRGDISKSGLVIGKDHTNLGFNPDRPVVSLYHKDRLSELTEHTKVFQSYDIWEVKDIPPSFLVTDIENGSSTKWRSQFRVEGSCASRKSIPATMLKLIACVSRK